MADEQKKIEERKKELEKLKKDLMLVSDEATQESKIKEINQKDKPDPSNGKYVTQSQLDILSYYHYMGQKYKEWKKSLWNWWKPKLSDEKNSKIVELKDIRDTFENFKNPQEEGLSPWALNNSPNNSLNNLNENLVKYGITSKESIHHFLVQCAVESGVGFSLSEDENKDYQGAGYLHLTGEENYRAFSEKIKQNKEKELTELEELKEKCEEEIDPETKDKEDQEIEEIQQKKKKKIEFDYIKQENIMDKTNGKDTVVNTYPWESATWFWTHNHWIPTTLNAGSATFTLPSVQDIDINSSLTSNSTPGGNSLSLETISGIVDLGPQYKLDHKGTIDLLDERVFLYDITKFLFDEAEKAGKEEPKKEKAHFPMKYMRITTGIDDGKHKAYWTHIGTQAIDNGGNDKVGEPEPVYAPYTGKVRHIDLWANMVWLESVESVEYPKNGGVGKLTMFFMHANDNDFNKLTEEQRKGDVEIKQGEVFYTEGEKKAPDNLHLHMECAKGEYQKGDNGKGYKVSSYEGADYTYYDKNGEKHTEQTKKGAWAIGNGDGIPPDEVLFLKIHTKIYNSVHTIMENVKAVTKDGEIRKNFVGPSDHKNEYILTVHEDDSYIEMTIDDVYYKWMVDPDASW
ncbi:hypothetical protein FACS189418_5700 [Clostridia bacterium]|nr:hypothetical protein FACS189418_5700 [Clostridia bacterium]